ncbi:MAG: hypothetical protein ABI207_06455 [Crocinitomicaceae bacterium]
MAKVYRLHEGQDGTGWFVSNQITKDQLSTIKTEGKDVASSIPSPFARIDLVKSAFAWVANNGIDGSSAQHKLVSDALDVAQLFFLYPKHKGNIKIVSWNPKDRFEQLAIDSTIRHSTFAETLKIFWNQDGKVYNFDKVHRLYFLLNNSNQVIGGTSPATLFFAAPDVNEAAVDLNIVCNDDFLFDDKYFSLAKRDKSFVEYMFTLSKQPNFTSLFPEVYSYLEEVKKNLGGDLRGKIASLNSENIQNYPSCTVLDNPNDPCEILGIRLGVQVIDNTIIEQESDFTIKPEMVIEGLKPLILPNDKFSNRWVYTSEGVIWNTNNQIPERNTEKPESSILPVQGGNYYWLSAGNFLEDKIVQLPYTIDNSKFKTCGAKKYLLPLTPTFFKYFKAENVSKYLKLEELAGGGIEARLDVPVKKGTITFKKTYHRDNIIEIELHLAVIPFLRVSNFDLDYTLGLQDKRFDKAQEILIQCYDGNKEIKVGDAVIRGHGQGNTIRSTYYKTKRFDSLRIRNKDLSGFIVPSMKECQSNQQVSFAVDFGTTNTHIEYKYGANVEKAIDTTTDLPIWQSLIDRNGTNTRLQIVDDNNYELDIFPYEFNENSNYKFPFRTALSFNQNINFNEPIEVFTHTNNFLLFEKLFYSNYLQIYTRLKWSNYNKPENKILVEKYIECLLYITLYKTILLNGSPDSAKITWMYPASMDTFEKGIFFEVWQKSYKKIFKSEDTDNINAIPESIAPYLYYRAEYPGLSLSIDIGGGSSDIAVFKNSNNLPEFISSFRFAGNAIFGDGFPDGAFTNSSDNNGFVKSYRPIVENIIAQGSQKEFILNDILKKRKDSSDFSSFLFSLENETDIVFNYSQKLREDKKLKLTILIFYGAVIYYSANLLKRQGSTNVPKNVLFSGTASKTIKIIDAAQNFPNASNLFKYLFNKVMGTDAKDIRIVLAKNPKEITCKGALRGGLGENISSYPILFWLGGNENSVWGNALNKSTDISNSPYYRDLEKNDNKILIENSINHFFDLLDKYFDNINLEGEFGIDMASYNLFRNTRSSYIQDYLEQGIKAFNYSPDKHIEETLFFYPLIGILNKLSFELANTE